MNMNMLRDNLHYGTPDLCNPSCLQQRKPRSDERQVQVQDPQPAPQLYPSSPPSPCIGLQQAAFIAQTNRRRQENLSNVHTINRKFQSHPYNCINSIELSRRYIWRPNTDPLLERAQLIKSDATVLKKWLKIADGLFAHGPSGKKRHLIRLIPLERHDIHQIQRHHHLEEDGVQSQSSRV